MRADVALQCQAFHRVKRRLNPALNVIITRLQHWDLPDVIGIALGTTTYFHGISSLDVPQNNNPSLNFYHPGRETYSTCKIHLAYTGKLAGLLHIVWDREVSPSQVLQYKQAAVSRSPPELPAKLRVDTEHLFPDSADEVRRAWTRIWWLRALRALHRYGCSRIGVLKQDCASSE
ncbi:hypothetical protein CCR75_005110 [Bremia lactucae]|uniref:Uncharacterized protein n=1 Tax=Bremia lactucae TaxID=4779 RepID=A0A976IEF6_BRELC|nr:hypothetical protein CCR75_005113 [Bremia lactucae]TDH68745.1 hypothetical protein CCR75_005110 [Bremia lactucae]